MRGFRVPKNSKFLAYWLPGLLMIGILGSHPLWIAPAVAVFVGYRWVARRMGAKK